MNLHTLSWAEKVFGHADLGHGSRTKRAVRMAARAAELPSGRITQVFRDPAERQGAYCFVQNGAIRPQALLQSIQTATVRRCAGLPFAFVAIDGSSITLTDRDYRKDFGSIGPFGSGARGLKVLDALAISPSGSSLGVASLQWWCRAHEKNPVPHVKRSLEEKETRYWHDAIDDCSRIFANAEPRLWFLLDREADSWATLLKLDRSGHWFTVRSKASRKCHSGGYLHERLAKQKCIGHMRVDVTQGRHRKARRARFTVRVLNRVTLQLRNKWTNERRPHDFNAVMVRESRTTPRGESPLQWVLLTNRPVEHLAQAKQIVQGYCYRWRIEEFHRTWKGGECCVQDSQLRTAQHVKRWATILAAVAARVERLKYLMRECPDEDATIELHPFELEILKLRVHSSRGYVIKSRAKPPPEGMPTISQAVRWIAQLGGYSPWAKGNPGATTIGRGLQQLETLVEGARIALGVDEEETD